MAYASERKVTYDSYCESFQQKKVGCLACLAGQPGEANLEASFCKGEKVCDTKVRDKHKNVPFRGQGTCLKNTEE